MDTKHAIQFSLASADMVVDRLIEDLTPAEMMTRPVPGANHVAWQLGHLISSERWLVEKAVPGKMEPLPSGFDEAHKMDSTGCDDASKFLSKGEYQRLAKQVRANTLKVVESLSEADFDKPIEGKLPPMLKSVGDVLLFIGPHWLMHAGQWSVIRRKLGRAPLF